MAQERETQRALRRRLLTDPADPGCGHAVAELERYAELVAAGSDPQQTFPALAVHFRGCRACRADLDGLLGALRRSPPR